ncbi:hypothetical protein [Mesobacterium pallidum]|uniref:hypothetical protein n=1 Tax=Mesobacterium pallidum TaxID=2872037 RepID=UPI001EE3867F|nr:hypothetical protein [Mesobacterium pallidum]
MKLVLGVLAAAIAAAQVAAQGWEEPVYDIDPITDERAFFAFANTADVVHCGNGKFGSAMIILGCVAEELRMALHLSCGIDPDLPSLFPVTIRTDSDDPMDIPFWPNDESSIRTGVDGNAYGIAGELSRARKIAVRWPHFDSDVTAVFDLSGTRSARRIAPVIEVCGW